MDGVGRENQAYASVAAAPRRLRRPDRLPVPADAMPSRYLEAVRGVSAKSSISRPEQRRHPGVILQLQHQPALEHVIARIRLEPRRRRSASRERRRRASAAPAHPRARDPRRPVVRNLAHRPEAAEHKPPVEPVPGPTVIDDPPGEAIEGVDAVAGAALDEQRRAGGACARRTPSSRRRSGARDISPGRTSRWPIEDVELPGIEIERRGRVFVAEGAVRRAGPAAGGSAPIRLILGASAWHRPGT